MRIGLYQHYSGKVYQVIGLGRIEATLEEAVIYRATYGNNDIWVRPLAEFTGEVVKNGVAVPRFKYLAEETAPVEAN